MNKNIFIPLKTVNIINYKKQTIIIMINTQKEKVYHNDKNSSNI